MIHYSKKAVHIDADQTPILIVVIDTEEEFDWNKPVDRASTSVESMQFIYRVQDIFDEYNIQPCYVIDYPIATQDMSINVLKPIHAEGRCEIGAHLHPWVNPPEVEELLPSNTYPGNLELSVEFEKLKNLTQAIRGNFGFSPTIYKAGRYGYGPNTEKTLIELGYEIDLSFCPSFNHSADGGPDYTHAHAQPFWINESLLEIPITGALVGYAGTASNQIFNLGQTFKNFKLPGILSRLGVVERLVLSPEGYSTREHIKLTNYLYNRGVRTFTWSFHSPTVLPGTTDYVQNENDLKVFLDSFRQYFDFFFSKLKGEASTPSRLKSFLESQ